MSKYGYFDLHRHDEASSFDGFGTPAQLATRAVELGYKALGISNHGVTYSNIQHYKACQEEGITPVLGCEVYFQPKFDKEKPSYHLCLFAISRQGFENMNKIISLAENTKYYKSRVLFKYLRKYSEGLICTSACIAGPVSQALLKGKQDTASKLAEEFVNIFGDNFYIEIQPYKVSDEGVQEDTNVKLINIAEKLGIKCVLTSDSHMGSESDFPTYLKMHEMSKAGLTYDIQATYGERYMPTEGEIIQRFIDMHSDDFGAVKSKNMALQMCKNLGEIQAKVEPDMLDNIPLSLPKLYGEDSHKELIGLIRAGLKRVGKSKDKAYVKRAKKELEIIRMHGFEDYFLIVSDYVNWAKEQGIAVGPGRGSVCNSLVAYLLGITTVDSIRFGMDFGRFLREDKKRLPDVDLDFEKNRRHEVLNYIIERYNASQIANYGLYKYDSLINDLAKVCGLETTGDDLTDSQKQVNKETVKKIKNFVKSFTDEHVMNWEALKAHPYYKVVNSDYDNLLVHFEKLFAKLRFIGTHAAGVVVSERDLCQYAPIRLTTDNKTKEQTSTITLDMADLEAVNAVKFDILGLVTMEGLAELRELTGKPKQWSIADTEFITDKKILSEFNNGNTEGVFQFTSRSGQDVLRTIGVNSFDEIAVASALNRPGPLSTGMPELYAEAKRGNVITGEIYKYTKETYGTIVFQEQILSICIGAGNMNPDDADKVLKVLKKRDSQPDLLSGSSNPEPGSREDLRQKFVKGCMSNGISENDAESMFSSMMVYTFNKGHSVGYSLISLEEMYYKVYHPTEYWSVKLKHSANKEDVYVKYQVEAVKEGEIIFLPHVNYGQHTSIRTVEGENIIQLGLNTIKGVGDKAAEVIALERAKRPFRSYDDFFDRCSGRQVHKKVLEKLQEQGAVEFKKKVYLNRVTKFNSTLYMKGMNK